MFEILVLCILGCFVVGSNGSPTVSFITPCKPEDEACIVTSAQAALPYLADGVPSLGVPAADPLVLDDITSQQGELQLQFKGLKLEGIRNCNFSKISLGADISRLKLHMACPITASGLYKVSGKLLVVPIEGEGYCEIKTEKISISVDGQLSTVEGADGKKHLVIDSIEHEYVPDEQVYFRLDNLFNGNEEKAKLVVDVFNSGWKQVMETVGKPIVQEIVDKAKEYINGFLAVVPVEELYINEH